jgi:hypothetical protein
MDSQYLPLIVLLGLGTLYKLQSQPKTVITETAAQRRSRDQSMLIDAWRHGGQYLNLSGSPYEDLKKVHYSTDLKNIRDGYTVKTVGGNRWLLHSHYFNTDGITKRQQFKGPSDEYHYPIQEMLSGWYTKAAQNYKPYLTRIVPTIYF